MAPRARRAVIRAPPPPRGRTGRAPIRAAGQGRSTAARAGGRRRCRRCRRRRPARRRSWGPASPGGARPGGRRRRARRSRSGTAGRPGYAPAAALPSRTSADSIFMSSRPRSSRELGAREGPLALAGLRLRPDALDAAVHDVARHLEPAEHPRDDLDGALDSSATTSWAPVFEEAAALEQVARAHEHRHLGGHTPGGVDDALCRVLVVHEQDQQAGLREVRVPERLLAGRVAVVNRQAHLLAAPHVLDVELQDDEAHAVLRERPGGELTRDAEADDHDVLRELRRARPPRSCCGRR